MFTLAAATHNSASVCSLVYVCVGVWAWGVCDWVICWSVPREQVRPKGTFILFYLYSSFCFRQGLCVWEYSFHSTMLGGEGAWCSVGVRPSLYLPREPRTELESELNSESRVFRLGCQPISRVTLPPPFSHCVSLAVSNVVFVAGAVVQTNI